MTSASGTDPLVEAIRSAVTDHYQRSDRPLFLASLGQMVSPPRDVSLRRVVEELLSSEFVIVTDPRIPTRTVIAPRDRAASVQNALVDLAPRGRPALGAYPRPLLHAFAKAPEGRRVFYRFSPPRYEVTDSPPGPSFVEIAASYRKALPQFQRLEDLSREDQQQLEANIARWTAEQSIPLQQLRHSATALGATPTEGSNALQRLLDAQSQEILERLIIPGDIAALLMRSK